MADERPPDRQATPSGSDLPLKTTPSWFDSLPATFWTTDKSLTLTFIEGAFVRNLDVLPSRLIGRSLADLLMDGREDHPLIQGHLAALDGHETSVRIEWGGRIHYARIGPMRDRSGEIIGCVGAQQEIGWLPDDEGTLRESDMRLRRVVDSNIIGIVFATDDGQITDANDAFLQLVGYTREDLMDERLCWPALAPVEFHARQIAAVEEIRATGRCVPFEIELIRKDGRRVTALVGAARLSARRREGVAFVLDVTEHRRSRQRLAAELACADALLEAPTPDAAIASCLRVLCEQLGWRAAALWQADAAGDSRIAARDGELGRPASAFDRLAAQASSSGQVLWSPTCHALFVPLGSGAETRGVLIAIDPAAGTPDEALLDTSRAVGVRLKRFLSR